MKQLILFAFVTLVLFLVLIALKQDILISIIVSVLCGAILSYYFNNLDINFNFNKESDKSDKTDTKPGASSASSASSSANSDAPTAGISDAYSASISSASNITESYTLLN